MSSEPPPTGGPLSLRLPPNQYIGRSVPRLEDPPLLTGRSAFAGDISFPRQLHMRIVRSPIAHGRILSVDTSGARAAPGVFAVWTAADIADLPPIDFREGRIERLEPYRQPVLAKERVRYVGEPVAAVFATDAYMAEDAADLIQIEFEDLTPLLEADAPPGEFVSGRSTEAAILRQGYGDIDAGMAHAHAIIELDLSVGRHSGVPLETRGAIGRYDARRDILELYGAAKVPHRVRDLLALMLGRSLSSIHVHESDVGGGFGVRGELYPEDVLVVLAALRFSRPVKWIEDRREHLVAANHSREQRHKIRAGVDADGTIVALDDEFWHDQGAYVRTHALRVGTMISGILPGPYRLPAYHSVGHFRLTNKTPAATYRAPGRYETTFVRERLIEAIAYRLGLDSIEVRRRNIITPAEMPFVRPLEVLGEEVEYDTGDYFGLLERVLARLEWKQLTTELAARRASGELVGAGVAMYVEKSGLGPSDGVKITVDPSGTVEVVTGGASLGQGFETVIAQVAAETLGVDYRKVRVIHGQTDRIEFGLGAHASRATVMSASATRVAALAVRDKALDMAAQLMQAAARDLDIIDGDVVRRDGTASMPLGAVAAALMPGSRARNDRTPGLAAEGWHHTRHQVYPYGSHAAVVSVDYDTGGVTILRYVIGYDIGRAINPMLVEGQIMGGFAQGLGGALLEEFSYSPRGDPLAVTFADYLMPTAREVPALEIILREDFPTTLNPLGLKGAGESGINAVGAAIANAVEDAIGMPGSITELPITPYRLAEILSRKPRLS